jgi:hypothetical protein
MRKLLSFYKQFADRLHLHWVSHYRRATGKPEDSGFSFLIYNSISEISDQIWDKANTSVDIFLSTSYLKAIEEAPPENMSFRYAVIKKENEFLGIAYFQILTLDYRLHQSYSRRINNRLKSPAFLQKIHNTIISTAGTTLLVCGNALISGKHGFCLPTLPEQQALHVIAEIAHVIRKNADPRITATLIKDFCNNEELTSKILSQFGYHRFNAGPNMVVPIRKTWTTFDTYLNEMKPKYRKRVASAIKKGAIIRRQSLSLEDAIRYRNELSNLYCGVVDNAKFKLFFLSPEFFISLKKHLDNKFDFIGYFKEDKLVGFTTRIINGDTMEGYTHGLLYELNKEFELYQNFLLDDVNAAISAQSSCIKTGRTSIAMKSSVGAVPEDMTCFIRFSGSHSNQLIKPLFLFIKPSNEYCRNPFNEH